MVQVDSSFLISPQAAVEKFLVDMRLAADRAFRSWKASLEAGLARAGLTAPDRRELLRPHPLEDYFYAGLIGLQAAATREDFPPTVAEALLRQVALQVDAATGRADRIVSNLVFIIAGRIRKNELICGHIAPVDTATDILFERLAIDRISATRPVMRDAELRADLNSALTARATWWPAFKEIYRIDSASAPQSRRSRAGAQEYFATRRTPASMLFERLPPPSPPLSAFARKLGGWLVPRPHIH